MNLNVKRYFLAINVLILHGDCTSCVSVCHYEINTDCTRITTSDQFPLSLTFNILSAIGHDISRENEADWWSRRSGSTETLLSASTSQLETKEVNELTF